MIEAHDARAHGTQVGAESVLAYDWLDIVIAVTRHIGAHDRELVGERGQPGERRTERYTGQARFHFASRAAHIRWRIHLRIECLDLARPALHEEKDHRLV